MSDIDKDKVVSVLNRILEAELAGVVRYTHYSLLVFGFGRIPIVSWLREQADESLAHAQQVGEWITTLGSYPSLAIGQLLDSHKHDIAAILRESLESERRAMVLYRELLPARRGKSRSPSRNSPGRWYWPRSCTPRKSTRCCASPETSLRLWPRPIRPAPDMPVVRRVLAPVALILLAGAIVWPLRDAFNALVDSRSYATPITWSLGMAWGFDTAWSVVLGALLGVLLRSSSALGWGAAAGPCPRRLRVRRDAASFVVRAAMDLPRRCLRTVRRAVHRSGGRRVARDGRAGPRHRARWTGAAGAPYRLMLDAS